MTQPRPRFGTLEFYESMAELLNNDPIWAEKGQEISCSMTFVFDGPEDAVFYMNFCQGRVTETAALSSVGQRPTDYVLSADKTVWVSVARQEVNLTAAIVKGKLKVKGKQTYLIRNMGAFSHVLDAMCQLDPIYT